MRKRTNHLHLLLMLMGLLMLFCTGITVSADAGWEKALIDGVEYNLSSDGNRHTASAFIDSVRGDHLPTELYIPRKVKYKNVTYKVESFSWNSPWDNSSEYMELESLKDDVVWRQNVVIPDKSRSYHACLKKITFARGVRVSGQAYDFEKLKQVVFEDPNDLGQALYYNCPKLKRLHLPEKFKYRYNYDIKNCPSLKLTIDKKKQASEDG